MSDKTSDRGAAMSVPADPKLAAEQICDEINPLEYWEQKVKVVERSLAEFRASVLRQAKERIRKSWHDDPEATKICQALERMAALPIPPQKEE